MTKLSKLGWIYLLATLSVDTVHIRGFERPQGLTSSRLIRDKLSEMEALPLDGATVILKTLHRTGTGILIGCLQHRADLQRTGLIRPAYTQNMKATGSNKYYSRDG
ncbi:hypothetical protein HD806DRAFT_521329 [Xylariaceae sp. AK1471]|nr:hypothetical protein HD806DRAFT_521329 [Xylariaceae sp. AK1471]